MQTLDVPHGQGSAAASAWVQRWTHLVKPGGTVLDVACGQGRHMAWFADKGLHTTGVDRSSQALAQAGAYGQVIEADIEGGDWPFVLAGEPQCFDVVVVTNYLWRPLLSTIVRSVAPGGLLIYETFANGNAAFGKPSNPDFLLQTGELLKVCQSMTVLAYEHGCLRNPQRCVQRIAAINNAGAMLDFGLQPHSLE